MSVGWDVEWCPLSRITTLLARKRPFHWISMRSRLVRAARDSSKFLNWSLLKEEKTHFQTQGCFLLRLIEIYSVVLKWKKNPFPLFQLNKRKPIAFGENKFLTDLSTGLKFGRMLVWLKAIAAAVRISCEHYFENMARFRRAATKGHKTDPRRLYDFSCWHTRWIC